MDYLDKLEEERAAASRPVAVFPPPLPVVPPGTLAYARPAEPSPVRAVGLAQRRVMWAILAAIVMTFSLGAGSTIVPPSPSSAIVMIVALLVARAAIIILMMVGVYQLATALGMGMTARVLCVLAMLVPLVNLIVLLVINQRATTMLRRHNVRVGLMGPRVSDLPSA